MKVLGYVRRSTDKQTVSAELQAQQLRESAELLYPDWELEIRTEDAVSGKSLLRRPVLAAALADLKAGRADALAVTKLDRLSRSNLDTATLLDLCLREGWRIICLAVNIDVTTPAGRFMAQSLSAAAEFERALIAQRTREGMAYIKSTTGKHMGRPSHIPSDVIDRMVELHHTGWSASAIAVRFSNESVGKGPATTSTIWENKQVTAALRRRGALLPWDEFITRRRQRRETVVAQG